MVVFVGDMPIQAFFFGLNQMSIHQLYVTSHMMVFYLLCVEVVDADWMAELEDSCWQNSYDPVDGVADMTQFVESFYLGFAHYDFDAQVALRYFSSNLMRIESPDPMQFLRSFHV